MNIKKENNTSTVKPRTLRVRGVLYLCILFSFLFFANRALAFEAESEAPKELTASLITCWPGSEIYELCGHEAIRIKGEGIDSVWNFGIFNFNEPNFVYRFVKGETDYNVAGYPFAYFLPEYIAGNRRVEEQVLNLSQPQIEKLRSILQKLSKPPYNRYRYNYIKNNCSTQIADALEEAAGGKIVYQNPVMHSTYRDAMRDYHKNYPWYQFGIDLALGSGLEEELSPREELFIPVEFHRHASNASLPDGSPLVKQNIILNEGSEEAVLPPTPWYQSPIFFGIILLLIAFGFLFYDRRRGAVSSWFYALFFGIEGLAGCLVAFLVFVSVHAATSPNVLIFWLNPLQLLVPIFIWSRRFKPVVTAMMWYNVIAVGLMIILVPFNLKGQFGQLAFLFLMGADFVLALGYLLNNMKVEKPIPYTRKKTKVKTRKKK